MTTSNQGHTKHKDSKHIAAHTTSDFSKVVKGAKGGSADQVQTKTRLTPDTRSHRSKENEVLRGGAAHPLQLHTLLRWPWPSKGRSRPDSTSQACKLLGEGMEGEKKRKTKEEKEKGTLGHTKTGEVCCEQAVSEGMRKDLQRERK